jgi:hypothetical protein
MRLYPAEEKAIEYIREAGKVDMIPPNQMAIPIAVRDRMSYINKAISELQSVVQDLNKTIKYFERDLYGNFNENGDDLMLGGRKRRKTHNRKRKMRVRKTHRKY